ncbi:hypothetical protein A2982_00100 [candidate division WWE3 bacterium RIFCSPLOWO2_01_FULL_39_13]|uniref:UVR domain-containing protein n=1 Tax=candidate division WWE3 bacterium RIFCSPLOWO2_01_FULL_39_13 TaxID=1802624 RepID=A0A1F4V473_UNCKA|nr:MAG: hypothetical protein A2982_00100 [candidate division WWE3 bacterium RIFCSPLOWO2_01_FULL_39_13]
MKWAHFLHIYQPADQHPGILEKIVNESYRPLLRGFFKIPETKVTLNVSAVLSELLFKNGYRDVIEDIKALVEMKRLELTSSAKYHAFLPLLPESEVRRQIELNDETNSRYFGKAYRPKGFFSPEMAYNPKIASIVNNLCYKWILADEVALTAQDKTIDYSTIYKISGMNLQVYFREKRPSNLIMGALIRSAESLKHTMEDVFNRLGYVITAMDGETFGHHRPGLENTLFSIMHSEDFQNVFVSDLSLYYKKTKEVKPLDSTWASSVEDVRNGNSYDLWFDKTNKIHEYEWQLASLATESVNNSWYSDKCYPKLLEESTDWNELTEKQKIEEQKKRQWVKVRDALDKALNSDPWWWASAKPWWSVESIEKGMNALFKVVISVPDASQDSKDQAEELYKNILFTAHEWQRKGMVDQMAQTDSESRRIPLSKRLGATVYYKALLKALKLQEEKASKNREYEQAIKWRDSQYKLERDLDIYDAVHVMDLFRSEGDFEKFNDILKEYRQKYREISKGQPE